MCFPGQLSPRVMISGNNRDKSFIYTDRKLVELAETFLFFQSDPFPLCKYYELNIVGHRAWLHRCFACITRSSVQAKDC